MSKYGVFSGPYFTVFGLNTEIYSVNLHIQSECRKIGTRKNSLFGHFSRSIIIIFVIIDINSFHYIMKLLQKYVNLFFAEIAIVNATNLKQSYDHVLLAFKTPYSLLVPSMRSFLEETPSLKEGLDFSFSLDSLAARRT